MTEMDAIGVSIPTDLKNRVDTKCAERGVENGGDTPSRSLFVREALRFYLEHYDEATDVRTGCDSRIRA